MSNKQERNIAPRLSCKKLFSFDSFTRIKCEKDEPLPLYSLSNGCNEPSRYQLPGIDTSRTCTFVIFGAIQPRVWQTAEILFLLTVLPHRWSFAEETHLVPDFDTSQTVPQLPYACLTNYRQCPATHSQAAVKAQYFAAKFTIIS